MEPKILPVPVFQNSKVRYNIIMAKWNILIPVWYTHPLSENRTELYEIVQKRPIEKKTFSCRLDWQSHEIILGIVLGHLLDLVIALLKVAGQSQGIQIPLT
jgi:hypothetical protein